MARDGVPQERPPGPGETTGEGTVAARHAAEATARLRTIGEEEPGWLGEDCPPDPDGDERDQDGWADLDRIIAEAEAAQADEDAARARLVAAGLEFGYAHTPGAPPIPGVKTGPGGGFGQDEPLDVAAPGSGLAMAADYAAGADRGFAEVCDDELFGILGARQRLEARQAWERSMAIAELIRRRPAKYAPVHAATRMPGVWDDGLAGELTLQLAISRRHAVRLLSLAWDLAVKLPRTSALLRDGIIDEPKAAAVAAAFANLNLDQALAAEDLLYACDDLARRTLGTIRDRAARHPGTGFCITLTGPDGRAAAHACGTPARGDPARSRKPREPGKPDSTGPPQITLTDRGPPGSHGTWRYQHGNRDLDFDFEDLAGPCDHKHQAPGHDPGKHLKHLTGVLNTECTHPACRRPEHQSDYEHTTPYEQGGRTCLCQAGPGCRTDHQDKQLPGWTVHDMQNRGWFTWTTPSGRRYTKGPTIYPT